MILSILQTGLRQRKEGGKHEEIHGHLALQNQNTNLSPEAQEAGFLMPLVPTAAKNKKSPWGLYARAVLQNRRSLESRQRAPGYWVWSPGDWGQWQGQWPSSVVKRRKNSIRAHCINVSRHSTDRDSYAGTGQYRTYHEDQVLIAASQHHTVKVRWERQGITESRKDSTTFPGQTSSVHCLEGAWSLDTKIISRVENKRQAPICLRSSTHCAPCPTLSPRST